MKVTESSIAARGAVTRKEVLDLCRSLIPLMTSLVEATEQIIERLNALEEKVEGS